MVYDDRRRAESFGDRAEMYDRVRPRYPAALWDIILPRPGLRVLDVGCGTGIAAVAMGDRGAFVIGVDVDERMAAQARTHGLEVEISSFEDWSPAGRMFDRVTAAQSWHWVDPVRGVARAAECLVAGGELCLFWNIGRPVGEVRAPLDSLYARALGPQSYSGYASGFHHERTREQLRDTPGFEELEMSTLPWEARYSTEEWLALLPTHSDHATLEPDERARLLEAVGEIIDRHGGGLTVGYATVLLRWRRLGEGFHSE
jgi:SAM-dependent methyltransferase